MNFFGVVTSMGHSTRGSSGVCPTHFKVSNPALTAVFDAEDSLNVESSFFFISVAVDPFRMNSITTRISSQSNDARGPYSGGVLLTTY